MICLSSASVLLPMKRRRWAPSVLYWMMAGLTIVDPTVPGWVTGLWIRQYFLRGLGPLIDHVQAKGMEFGLWVEPEMVNPDSDLYRAHPDWVLSAGSGLGMYLALAEISWYWI